VGDEAQFLTVNLPTGRVLEVLVAGPADGFPLLEHTGTPTAATPHPSVIRAATARGLRWITFSRPGYAGSTPKPERVVADIAGGVTAILDSLGVDTFVTMGSSGGGPHAIGCTALLPDRCLAAAAIASVAPYPAEGIDWLDGMAPDNVEEFSVALQGADALSAWLEPHAAELAGVQPDQVVAALGDLVSDVDRAVLTGEEAEWGAETFRRAVSTGIAGWRDDDLAFTRPWGFDLAAIGRPVAVWQGGQDRMVPFAHGEWLAAHIPTAFAHLYPAEGHLSIGVAKLDEILDDLLVIAGVNREP
jgi:pimeloyl-ACP methyl ester carboxylesterase